MASETLHFCRRNEIVIGLIGAAGTDLARVELILKDALQEVGYGVPRPIKLSESLRELYGSVSCHATCSTCQKSPRPGCEYCRISHLMDCGDDLRKRTQNGEAVALLGIAQIRRMRSKEQCASERDRCQEPLDAANAPKRSTAYILHSMKHPQEAVVLRGIHGAAFIAVFAYGSIRIAIACSKATQAARHDTTRPVLTAASRR